MSKQGKVSRFKKGHHSIGHNNANFKGGRGKGGKKGRYDMIKMPLHPNSYSNGYVLLHVYVMSKFLGRPLMDGEDVHHIDNNPHNNDISNLQLLSHAEHARLSKKIDVTGRQCYKCSSMKTYIDKKGNHYWYISGGKFNCKVCYEREYYLNTRKRKRSLFLLQASVSSSVSVTGDASNNNSSSSIDHRQSDITSYLLLGQ